MGWFGHPNIFLFFFWFFFFLDFFLKNKLCDKDILGGKKGVKVVEFSQFKSLGGLSIIFKTLEVKAQMDG
jgi:hypothetical protein